MLSKPIASRLSALRLFFCAFVLIGCLPAFTVNVRAGFLYVLRQQDGAANQIYGYSVNETNGSLTLLAGFPVSSGGNGIASTGNFQMTIDRVNQRLYVVNTGSINVSALAINPTTGALTPLPFSPLGSLSPTHTWSTIDVHPSGSPVVVGSSNANPAVVSFKITAASGSAVSGVPLTTGNASSIAFSRDGSFVYAGGGSLNTFAGLRVDSKNAFLFSLPNSPFDSGASTPSSYATDSKGRLFLTNALTGALRAFTIVNGIPTAVTGNPFASGLVLAGGSVLHPNENFLFVADRSGSRVGAFQISGSGAATTLAPVAGSPVNSGGTETNAVALNAAGNFLFATNNASRNLSTYGVNPSTGALSFISVQAVNTLGTSGTITGIAYQPSVFTVTNANNTLSGSLRQAVQDANTAGGGVIVFDPNVFNVPRTIFFTSGGQLSIQSNITIVGPGANLLTLRNMLPVSGSTRIINISGSDHSVDLRGMTLTGGRTLGDGGGISNVFFSILMVRDCLISGNTANGEGGGIANVGTLNVVGSTISGNSSNATNTGGGGIDSLGPTFVTNSTVSSNTKITNTTSGAGGIFIGNAPLTITNSTITNNTANNGASGVFDGSGGGSPVLLIRNSIIAGNQNNSTVPDVAGSFTSGGFNLIGNVGAATGFNQTGDQTGSGASPLNPGLVKVLAPNGGIIPTHALLPNSPAVDKGNSSNLLNDQRGFGRLFNYPAIPNTSDGADIGAFERRALEPNITAPFDFDGDNRTDISVFRPSDGSWWYLQSSDLSGRGFSFGLGTDIITPGDYTGDGRADIAIFRPSTAEWFIQRSEDGSYAGVPFGLPGDFPAPADYDGDEITDLAVFRPSNQTWFIQQSGGGFGILTFGLDGDRPVPADYDGDGKADIAVWRPSEGSWWYVRSSDFQQRGFGFGTGTDKPVPGDYTGDGKADIAVWRDSTREWFFLRSEDGSYYSYPSGLPGDIPSPGDYDGDGKFDSAVFRPSTQTWFIDGSTAGSMIATFGLNGDRPVPNAFVP